MATTPNESERRPGFPFLTAGTALVVLFTFLGLTWLMYHRPNPLASPTPTPEAGEAKTAPPTLDEIKKRNDAALGGVGAKMSRDEARTRLLTTLKKPTDTLPFPTPEPLTPAPPKQAEPKGKTEEKKGTNPRKNEEKKP